MIYYCFDVVEYVSNNLHNMCDDDDAPLEVKLS